MTLLFWYHACKKKYLDYIVRQLKRSTVTIFLPFVWIIDYEQCVYGTMAVVVRLWARVSVRVYNATRKRTLGPRIIVENN